MGSKEGEDCTTLDGTVLGYYSTAEEEHTKHQEPRLNVMLVTHLLNLSQRFKKQNKNLQKQKTKKPPCCLTNKIRLLSEDTETSRICHIRQNHQILGMYWYNTEAFYPHSIRFVGTGRHQQTQQHLRSGGVSALCTGKAMAQWNYLLGNEGNPATLPSFTNASIREHSHSTVHLQEPCSASKCKILK